MTNQKRFTRQWTFVVMSVLICCATSVFADAPSRWKLDGSIEAGIWKNDHGAEIQYENGVMVGGNSSNYTVFYPKQQTTDFTLSQLWLTLEREADISRNVDWGFRTDCQYGTFAPTCQSQMSETFDYALLNRKRGSQYGDYATAINQAYGSIGYRQLNISVGEFFSPVRKESLQGADNFFYTNSLLFRIEPMTHAGVRAEYAVNDRFSVLTALTNGYDNGFNFSDGDVGVLAGFSFEWNKYSSFRYYTTTGRFNNSNSKPNRTYEREGSIDFWVQSFVYEWQLLDNVTESLQWDVSNNDVLGSQYGLSYTRIVPMGKHWSRGFRATWCRSVSHPRYNGSHSPAKGSVEEYELSFGLNWKPIKQFILRPEVRYDTFQGDALSAEPRFNRDPNTRDYRNNNQFSYGFSLIWMFGVR
ncbi:MAG: outer membrane beta-barrel protein [Thermoguttaceae bacterium]